jgi:hypothetical protein
MERIECVTVSVDYADYAPANLESTALRFVQLG